MVNTLAGQTSTGGSVSLTVTVNVQVLVLPAASMAVQVTGVVPVPKLEPVGGLQLTVTPGQFARATGREPTTSVHCPGAVSGTTWAGHTSTRGSGSLTVEVH